MLKLVAMATVLFAVPALAQEAAQAAEASQLHAFGKALAFGIAALGGALGQSKAASSALEGISRNPGAYGNIFTPMVLSLALIESLVILAFVLNLL
ncbi:MAG: ATP synthase F0 subunit C [Bdellovibrionales bacterium]|nr:ATP synthase F0 subunit C [Bdellovibrionales bacterium]